MGTVSFLFSSLAALGLLQSILLTAAPALAEKRVALVIGNDRYPNLPPERQLLKAVNDADAVGDTLAQMGFDVIRGSNLGRQGMIDKVSDLTARVEAGDTAFVFYAGHGVALGGVNYLVPSDVPRVVDGAEARVRGGSIAEGDIVAELQGKGVRVAVLVIDACRDNPFPRSGGRSVGNTRGLGDARPARGVFTLYSAGIGQAALDRLEPNDPNRNSVFTRVFVEQLAKPGLHLSELAVEVRERVAQIALKAKNDAGREEPHEQTPAYYDQTIGGRIFLAGLPPDRVAAVPSVPPTPVQPQPDPAERTWAVTQSTTSIAVLETFIGRFGNTIYGDMARARLEELKKSRVAVVAPPVVPAAPPPPVQPAVGIFPPPPDVTPLSPERERSLKPKDSFKECADCPEMVVVPAGSFTMGSPTTEKDRNSDEGPIHRVSFARPFAVGKFEVTVDQFSAFFRDSGYDAGSRCWTFEGGKWEERSGRSFRNPGFSQTGSHPAACVNWNDAKAYVAWLSRKTGKTYRLLSEAEWEYAARGGTTTPYSFGNGQSFLCGQGNGADQTAQRTIPGASAWTIALCDDGHAYTAAGGSYAANAFGLHDMHGNVWEWNEDCWNGSYKGASTDGSAWTTGDCSRRVMRGGSWSKNPKLLRTALRHQLSRILRYTFNGFRVARALN